MNTHLHAHPMRHQTIINGNFITPHTFDTLLKDISEQRNAALALPCPTEAVLSACQNFANYLKDDTTWLKNLGIAHGLTSHESSSLNRELSLFCQREYLVKKLIREFKTVAPFTISRPNLKENIFEGWQALGAILHITPGNAISLPFMAVVEGLLSGNFNILKPSHKDNGLSAALLHRLISFDSSNTLVKYVAVVNASRDQLPALMALVDGVSAWGSDSSLSTLRGQVPTGCRFIEWGHKLSFTYLDQSIRDEHWFDSIAQDICEFDQQACSSPQIVMVNTSDWERLLEVGMAMTQAMTRISDKYPALQPSPQETAEITNQVHLAGLESALGEQKIKIWEDPNGYWRIILTDKPGIQPSPLFRTLLISPAPSEQLISTLQPFRHWLQTCALIAQPEDYSNLVQILLAAGVTRITAPGAMHDEYPGEPHDGVYTLAQLARRVSINPKGAWPNTKASLKVSPFQPPKEWQKLPIMKKSEFILRGHHPTHAELFFQSGGTSGQPKLSTFSYSDYHLQMETAADGLLAAGMEPATDRVMNLLYAGNLYAGFYCYSTVLDKLGVKQFPMGGPMLEDLPFVARVIIDQKVNTLVGMPNTLFLLFSQQKELLSKYRGIKKIFYGGEFLGLGQRKLFEEMGIELIRSAMYGSVDAGILGYACAHCSEGTFHLITKTQSLEILQLESDLPVEKNQIGRLIFSSNRSSQPLPRYEIGDIGRWVTQECPCGSAEPKFELLGRIGDVVKIGTNLIDCKRIQTWVEQHSGYQGILQIRLDYNIDNQERISLCFHNQPRLTGSDLRKDLISFYPELNEGVRDQLLELEIEYNATITQNPHSGKFPLIVDLRNSLIHATF